MLTVEEPARRITSQELLAWCEQKLTDLGQGAEEEDNALGEWAASNFSEPPAITTGPEFEPSNPSDDQVRLAYEDKRCHLQLTECT